MPILYPHISFEHRIRLTTRRADEVLGPEMVADAFLNIDVQGSELAVLHGFGETLKKASAVYCEVTTKSLYEGDSTWEEVDHFLSVMGFVCVDSHILADGWGDALWLPRGSTTSLKMKMQHLRKAENRGLNYLGAAKHWGEISLRSIMRWARRTQ